MKKSNLTPSILTGVPIQRYQGGVLTEAGRQEEYFKWIEKNKDKKFEVQGTANFDDFIKHGKN